MTFNDSSAEPTNIDNIRASPAIENGLHVAQDKQPQSRTFALEQHGYGQPPPLAIVQVHAVQVWDVTIGHCHVLFKPDILGVLIASSRVPMKSCIM